MGILERPGSGDDESELGGTGLITDAEAASRGWVCGQGKGVGLEGSGGSIAQVGNKILNRGCDRGGEGGLPLEEVVGGGGVVVVAFKPSL